MKFKVNWSSPKKFEEGNLDITVPGVYIIGYRDTATDRRHIIYVGQGEIGDRLAHHLQHHPGVNGRVSKPGRVGYYRYASCADENTRLDIELALYRKHGGQSLCNAIEPPGSGRYPSVEVEEVFG